MRTDDNAEEDDEQESAVVVFGGRYFSGHKKSMNAFSPTSDRWEREHGDAVQAILVANAGSTTT